MLKADRKINFFKKFSWSEYAIDLRFKKDLIQNQLSAKELYIAKYYMSVQKWIPAINRLKNILEKYDKTILLRKRYIGHRIALSLV